MLRPWIALIVLAFALPALADETRRTVRVSGEGKATAPPDLATIHTGVVTQAASAAEAVTANNKAMERVNAALKGFGILPKDVQTSNFDVRPLPKLGPDGRQLREIMGYQVTNQVRVRVREIARLGEVLDGLVQAGSNQVAGISFDVADSKAVLDQARRNAIADARRRAQVYAQEAGVKVGKVHTISEQSLQPPQPLFFGRGEAATAQAVPVSPGEHEVQVHVNVVFDLEDR
jgi:uncharacterized protein YggE